VAIYQAAKVLNLGPALVKGHLNRPGEARVYYVAAIVLAMLSACLNGIFAVGAGFHFATCVISGTLTLPSPAWILAGTILISGGGLSLLLCGASLGYGYKIDPAAFNAV
jgi:hypothetical protein